MSIPEAAIEAATRALYAQHSADEPGVSIPQLRRAATAALSAAMPDIREAIAQEIEVEKVRVRNVTPHWIGRIGMQHAAAIVRGGA